MKRWAVLTVLIYALALIFLTAPVILIAGGNWGENGNGLGFHDLLQLYLQWGYWLWLAVIVVGQ
ncbi:MAG TPA: hypothetical protein VK810_05390, partial [Dongiaceae bacterium]|nr:hypothetical protein [Dongiaceae bacterium]